MADTIIILLLAWMLDWTLGDPVWLPHPVVAYGKWIYHMERILNCGNHRKLKGAVFAVFSIMMSFLIGCIVLYLAKSLDRLLWNVGTVSPFYLFISVVLLFFCLAGTTLVREVKAVFLALDESLEKGRNQVSRIVGRDTQNLSAQEVRAAALETLAENLSDGVIAPLFWFLLLGVPGALMYKMVNTLDSMIGYQNIRYKDFGCWAARIDDAFNFIPARLTAYLMALVSGKPLRSLLKFIHKFAHCHASPNSGWPESALAGILDCRFGGPHDYFGELFYKPYIGTNARELTTQDMRIAIAINRKAEVLWMILLLLVPLMNYLIFIL